MFKWFKNLFKKKSMFDLTEKVVIKVSPAELNLYETDAERNGMDLQQWARKGLNSSVSKSTVDFLRRSRDMSAAENAFSALDEEDRVLLGTRKPSLTVIDNKVISGHPCFHNDARTPPNYAPSDCQGTCRANTWNGRPCNWDPRTASKCMRFSPKVIPMARR